MNKNKNKQNIKDSDSSQSQQMQQKKVRMRTARNQYSNITDWCGRRLDPEIRDHFVIGNIVRLVVQSQLYPAGYKWYFRIVKKCKKQGRFIGIKEDPYWTEDREGFRNGEKILFTKYDVTEIPLDWQGNDNLQKIAKHRLKKTHQKFFLGIPFKG